MTPYGPRRRQPAESLDEPTQLSATDIAAMKRLEAAWRDFGGPPASDIFVQFGISAEEFYRRLRALHDRKPNPEARRDTQERKGAISDRRVNWPSGPHPLREGNTP